MSADPITRLNTALRGRYEIERELGEGGMATVYLARDERHNRHVALKVLKADLAAVVGAERFLSEIETTANLQHPNILPLFDSGEAEGFLFYVMPYVEGESLRERLDREKQLRLEEAVGITRKVASALDYAHKHGVVHRDIKPANILLNEQAEPVVADFGIALAVQQAGGGRLTETGLSVGTPFYMSPEQATADRDPDARSDIYSLGSVLYEMLTGEPPFTGNTAQAVLGKILTGSPSRPTELRPSIPPHAEAVALKALERLPADRFESAAELGEALGDPSFRHGEGPAAVGTAAAEHVAELRRRVRVLAAASAALGVALVVALASRGSAPATDRVVEFYIRGDSTHEIVSGAPSSLALSPGGDSLAYVGRSAGVNRIYLRPLGDRTARVVPSTEGARDVTFSPDGRRLAFSTLGNEIRTIRLAGGSPRTVATAPGNLAGLSWAPDDRLLYGVGGVPGLMSVAEEGGVDPVELLAQDSALTGVLDPWMLGDEGQILFTGLVPQPFVFTLDPRSGDRRRLTEGQTPRYVEGHLVYGLVDGTVFAQPFDPRRGELGGEPVRLATGVGGWLTVSRDLAVSPSGTIAYIEDASNVGRQLLLRRLDPVISQALSTPSGPRWPRISPDGDHVLYAVPSVTGGDSEFSLYSYSVSQQSSSLVVPSSVGGGTWSPDGGSVIYSDLLTTGTAMAMTLLSMPLSGGEPRVILRDPANSAQRPSYTWDGQRVVYENTRGDILVIPADGSAEPVPVAATPGFESQARPSPTGPWVAYTSDVTGRPEVYVTHLDRPGSTTVSGALGGLSPVWASSGDTLFYLQGSDIIAAALSLEEQVTVLSRENTEGTLADVTVPATPDAPPEYDVHPQFQVTIGASSGGGAIVVRTALRPMGG